MQVGQENDSNDEYTVEIFEEELQFKGNHCGYDIIYKNIIAIIRLSFLHKHRIFTLNRPILKMLFLYQCLFGSEKLCIEI